MMNLSRDLQEQFMDLVNQLSPENLYQDGELSHSQAMARKRDLLRKWAALERQVGRRVSQAEVENEYDSRYARISDRIAAFVDQPAPWDQETEDQLEKEQTEAEQRLKRELREVKGRYYWSPGHTISINITLTGRPLLMDYRLGGLFGVGYRDGILTINPQWVSAKDSLPSYAWAPLAEKMIHTVKQSPRIAEMVDKTLDMVEGKVGFKIEPNVRQAIIRWCEMAAERRLSVHSYPGPKGKEFVIKNPNEPQIASRIASSERCRDLLRSYRHPASPVQDMMAEARAVLAAFIDARLQADGLDRAGAGGTEEDTLLETIVLPKVRTLAATMYTMQMSIERALRG